MFVSQSVVQSDASECHVRTSEMSELTIDVEKRLREKRDDFMLKQQLSAKSVGRTVSEMRSRLNEDTIEAVELLRWGMRAYWIALCRSD